MNKIFVLTLLLIVVVMAGCVPVTTTPSPLPLTATLAPIQVIEVPVATNTAVAPVFTGTEVSYGVLSLVIPGEVADGASGSEVPPFDGDEAAWWQKTPGHLQVMLGDYYTLQGKSIQPGIYVYPALDYAVMLPVAFESMHRLNNLLDDPSLIANGDQLPIVPFFNAQQVFASNAQVIAFQNGRGVRFLCEYGQYPAPANNVELFYQFQGLSNDGEYYIVAIFPITAPGLGDSSDPVAALPINGIAYPDMSAPLEDWDSYYGAVTQFLNATPADTFFPTLGQLDQLIQSMQISL